MLRAIIVMPLGQPVRRVQEFMHSQPHAPDERTQPKSQRDHCIPLRVPILGALLSLLALAACDVERRKSDAELGLTAQQAAGRKIYDAQCDRCHEPYSTRGKKGPGLQGVFQKRYLPISGLPANDERVTDIIRLGRKEMPGFSQSLNGQDIQDLLAYMHTL
jgi:mono/diheme cytochrome c family protein